MFFKCRIALFIEWMEYIAKLNVLQLSSKKMFYNLPFFTLACISKLLKMVIKNQEELSLCSEQILASIGDKFGNPLGNIPFMLNPSMPLSNYQST
jgi:hypothetical protein